MSAIGIDLGTTYSLVAVATPLGPQVLPGAGGELLLPSVVALGPGGALAVGLAAEALAASGAPAARSFKSRMGAPGTVRLGGRDCSPVELSTAVLAELRDRAAAHLGAVPRQAVISVPAYFDERARADTLAAAQAAGLEVLRLVAEPTAAALAYGFGRSDGERVLVWDLGGGTFDLSLLEFHDGLFEVRATAGDRHLGGDDFTAALAGLLAAKAGLGAAAGDLRALAETAKRALSAADETAVELPGGTGVTVRREEFEAAAALLLERLLRPAKAIVRDTGLGPADCAHVLLVGGSTRLPCVRSLITRWAGRPGFAGVDPDLAVAQGAALLAAMLTGGVERALLLDLTPLSLGIETKGGLFSPIIPRQTRLPAVRDRLVTTAQDWQDEVEIHVLQGERELAAHNLSLGRFTLTGLPSLPAGQAKVQVTFTLDLNGLLAVEAEELETGETARIRVARPGTPGGPAPE